MLRVTELGRKFTVVLFKADDGGYTVTVPALRGCVTEGDTLEEALENAREAIRLTLEDMARHGEALPEDVLVEEVFVCDTVTIPTSR